MRGGGCGEGERRSLCGGDWRLAVGGLRAGGLAAAGWWADGGGDTRKAGV